MNTRANINVYLTDFMPTGIIRRCHAKMNGGQVSEIFGGLLMKQILKIFKNFKDAVRRFFY
jgi:hypothetical protein